MGSAQDTGADMGRGGLGFRSGQIALTRSRLPQPLRLPPAVGSSQWVFLACGHMPLISGSVVTEPAPRSQIPSSQDTGHWMGDHVLQPGLTSA